MRILLITTVYPSPQSPNKGAFNARMVEALSRDNEIRVVCPVPWTTTALRRGPAAPPGACRHSAGRVDASYPSYFYTPKVLRQWYGHFMWWSIRNALRSIASDFMPDVVMGYWAHPDSEAAVRFARALAVPSVVMVGGTDVLVLAGDKGRRRRIDRVLDQADAVVTVSQDIRRTLVRRRISSGKLHVVYRGVDAGRFHAGDRAAAREALRVPADARALLWVGHMVAVKGVDVLVEACGVLRERTPFHLYLVGDGPMRPELERRCRALGLEKHVTFVGYVRHSDLADWYRAVDVTVLPSRSEGVPNVLLESIASGTPFVASRVGGVPEIADPLIDRLVQADDPDALAEGIAQALTARSRIARRFVPVSIDAAATELIEVLQHVVNARRSVAARTPEWAIAGGMHP